MSQLPTLLLLAGNMCDGRLWEGGGGVLTGRLQASGFAVARPMLEGGSIPEMAERLASGFPGLLLPVGFSMGGIAALALARIAPERIVGIGLIDTNPAADLPERAAARPRQQHDVSSGELERVVVEELKPNYLAARNRDDERLLHLLRDMALALGPDTFVLQSEALRTRPDLTGVLPTLAVPAFIACGAEDRLCPPEWHRDLAAGAKDAELHIVEGSGHMLPLEQPHRLAELLGAWLERVKGRMLCPTES